jgi:hypothetical protein
MISQQDIFLIMNPRDMMLFNPAQQTVLQSQFFLNGNSVTLLLTDSYIVLTEVVFILFRPSLLLWCTVVNLIFLSNLKSCEQNGK